MSDILLDDEARKYISLDNKNQYLIIGRLVRFHIEFEGIHPFIDENGRTGRLLVNARLDSYFEMLEIL